MTFQITDEQVRNYHEDGFLFLRSFFDSEQMDLLLSTAKADRAIEQNAIGLQDGSGGVSKLSLWYRPGDDLYGMFSRCKRIVNTTERLIGHEVYHYHSKMMLKEPFTGGAWSWHQDYGYWYDAGYLYPAMLSCLIAVDRANRENGCLQILKGSHRMGRINHGITGDQTGVDPERLDLAFKLFPLVHCEMEPGDALFFDCNLLHGSAQNKSPNPRWSLICCYTATYNTPYKEPRHPGYEKLLKVPDTAIKETGPRGISAESQFMKLTAST